MMPRRLPLLLGLCALLGATGVLHAQSATRIASNTPVINFRLPTFTPEGYRAWLLRGSEAMFTDDDHLAVKELSLTIFTGNADDRIDTMLLSPSARIVLSSQTASGEETIRMINGTYEATGRGWTYLHKDKKVLLHKHVRVVIRSELQNFLQ